MSKDLKWFDPLSHWVYFIIFACGQVLVILLLWGHALWSALNLDFIAALKASVLIQFISLLTVGLFFVFRFIGRVACLHTA